MSKHVFIPGGAGYLGSILSEHLLAQGYRVTVLDNLMYRQRTLFHLCHDSNFEFVFGDVRDEKLLGELAQRADVIIPLAAIVGAPACDREPELTVAIHVESMRNLRKYLTNNQLVIYPTTNSGYGTQTGDVYCTEETALDPISLYGKTKVQAELEWLEYSNAITLRLATVFGMAPRMRLDLLVNDFTYKAFTDKYLVIFEKDFKRNYIHIRDIADCFIHCIENSEKMVGRPFNVGLDNANLSKEELALKIKEYVPQLYIHFAPIGSDPDKRNYIVSNQRLREAGFEAKRSLDEGIQELLKGYKMLARMDMKNI
jgi:nucleoside-diphosphate-sugar epimerase